MDSHKGSQALPIAPSTVETVASTEASTAVIMPHLTWLWRKECSSQARLSLPPAWPQLIIATASLRSTTAWRKHLTRWVSRWLLAITHALARLSKHRLASTQRWENALAKNHEQAKSIPTLVALKRWTLSLSQEGSPQVWDSRKIWVLQTSLREESVLFKVVYSFSLGSINARNCQLASLFNKRNVSSIRWACR